MIFKLAKLAVLGGTIALVVASLPDLKRYLELRSM
jgi:hypothetical protein